MQSQFAQVSQVNKQNESSSCSGLDCACAASTDGQTHSPQCRQSHDSINISPTTHTVCRGMTTYDFIVHEQKKLRDKSPAGAIPAAEINTEVVEVEDETTRVVGEGGGDNGGGGDMGGEGG